MNLELDLLPGQYTIIQIPPDHPLPPWLQWDDFTAITRTKDELSLVCESNSVPGGLRSESGWRILKVKEKLDFSLVGILAGLARVLAEAGVSIFVISTFNTDYILVKEGQLEVAINALVKAGYEMG